MSRPPGGPSSRPPGAACRRPAAQQGAQLERLVPRQRGGVAIIVVPATLTYLVNMWNVQGLLEEQRLVDCMEKRRRAAPPASIKIRHV